MDEAARAKHEALKEQVAHDPQAAATLDSIQEWREAEIRAINTRNTGIRWLVGAVASLALVAIGISLSFGLLGLFNTNAAHRENIATRQDVAKVLTLATGAICSGAPRSPGCPPINPGQQSVANQQQQIVTQLLQSAVVASKANCVAGAQQLSITSGIPAATLLGPCDAIK